MTRVLLLLLLLSSAEPYDFEAILSSCGVTHGCFVVPPECIDTGENCTAAVWWAIGASSIYFEFVADMSLMQPSVSTVWSAVGFSLNEHMDKDTVLECVHGPDYNGTVRVTWNDKSVNYYLPTLPSGFISNTTVAMEDGFLVCSAQWNVNVRQQADSLVQSRVYDLSSTQQFNLLLARGYANPITLDKSSHIITDGILFPWISGATTGFCASCGYGNLSDSAHQSIPTRKIKHTFAISHGVLMMTAWWVLGSTGILSARYLKHAETTCCTAPVWWALHRPLMVLSFVFATVAFFLIYYADQFIVRTCTVLCSDDDYETQLHALLGTFTYSLMCLQVLMGLLRPGKESSVRAAFNWAHWFVGSAAWICATTTCILALPFGKIGITTFFQHWPKHVMTLTVTSFIVTVAFCEFFHRREERNSADKESRHAPLSAFVPFVIVVNLLIAIASIAILTYMMLMAYQGYGFTL